MMMLGLEPAMPLGLPGWTCWWLAAESKVPGNVGFAREAGMAHFGQPDVLEDISNHLVERYSELC